MTYRGKGTVTTRIANEVKDVKGVIFDCTGKSLLINKLEIH